MRTIILAAALAFGALTLPAHGQQTAPKTGLQGPDGAVVVWKAQEGEPTGWISPDGSPPPDELEIPDGHAAEAFAEVFNRLLEGGICLADSLRYSRGWRLPDGRECVCVSRFDCGWARPAAE